jgi:CRISPR-associated protein Cas6/Cse3/CasE subtype I-E
MTYAVAAGESYLFRMAINPVVVQQKRRIPTTAEAWLEKRDLGADLVIQDVVYTTHHDRSGSGCRVVTEVATVSGLLTVTNPERLLEVLHNGIGRGRAYGAGLLSIVPADT